MVIVLKYPGNARRYSDTATAPRVVVINQYLARRYWPDEDPIGKHLTLDNPAKVSAEKLKWLTVVGVVKNAVRSDWAAPPEEEIFLPYSQNAGAGSYLTLVARTARDPAASAVPIETAIWGVDRNVAVSEVQTMDAVIARANSQSRFNAALLATFAVVALIMSAVGIYGVMTYAVTRRRHEIGVRMALGASRANVLGDILKRGMALALAGSVIGVSGGLILSRLMATLLYGVQPSDLLTFSGAAALLIMVALAACYVPARHATRVDPVVALRYELRRVGDATGALAVHDSIAAALVVSLGAGGPGIGRRVARPPRTKNRGIRRESPGFTAAVVLTLALGIGATTAIFTLINVEGAARGDPHAALQAWRQE